MMIDGNSDSVPTHSQLCPVVVLNVSSYFNRMPGALSVEQHEEELRSAKHRAAMAPEQVMGEAWARACGLILRWNPYFSLSFLGSQVAFAIFSCLLFMNATSFGKVARGWITDVPKKNQPRFNPPETSFRPLWTWDHRMHQNVDLSCDGLDYLCYSLLGC